MIYTFRNYFHGVDDKFNGGDDDYGNNEGHIQLQWYVRYIGIDKVFHGNTSVEVKNSKDIYKITWDRNNIVVIV